MAVKLAIPSRSAVIQKREQPMSAMPSATSFTAAVHEEECCAREEADVHVSTHLGLPRPVYELAASLAK